MDPRIHNTQQAYIAFIISVIINDNQNGVLLQSNSKDGIHVITITSLYLKDIPILTSL